MCISALARCLVPPTILLRARPYADYCIKCSKCTIAIDYIFSLWAGAPSGFLKICSFKVAELFDH